MQYLALKLRFLQQHPKKQGLIRGKLVAGRPWLLWTVLTFLIVNPAFSQEKTSLAVVHSLRQYKSIVSERPAAKLVPVSNFLSPLHQKVYYQTEENFTHHILYNKNYRLYLSEIAAKQLAKVQDSLQKLGLDLLIFDGYRPYEVTKNMWKLVADKRYVADPAFGSGHNRGIAVDLTLVDARTGALLEMPSGYDNFSDSAHHDFTGSTPVAAKNRALLKSVMEHFDFMALPTEWWHYSLKYYADFPVYDISFESLNSSKL